MKRSNGCKRKNLLILLHGLIPMKEKMRKKVINIKYIIISDTNYFDRSLYIKELLFFVHKDPESVFIFNLYSIGLDTNLIIIKYSTY